jgi:hypothetical protein
LVYVRVPEGRHNAQPERWFSTVPPTCLGQVKRGMNMGKRCLQSRPGGPAPNVSPARKGWETESAEDPGAVDAALHSSFVHRERIPRDLHFTPPQTKVL